MADFLSPETQILGTEFNPRTSTANMNYGMDYQGGDSGGGGGGGGFSNNDYGGGSQGSPEKKRRNYDEQTLIPVTISMVYQAGSDSSGGSNDVLTLKDGRPLHQVKIIGAVRTAEVQSTNIMYTLEDGTGAIDVKQWSDDNDAEAIGDMKRQTAREGIYVKVIGQISNYEGRKQVVANSVQTLSSGDELTHHLLEVMYSGEKFKQADSIVSAPIVQKSNGMGFGNRANQLSGGDDSDSTKERVLQFLRENDSETGASIDACIQQLSDIAEADIRRAADDLSEEGQIYSTINESFFKVAM